MERTDPTKEGRATARPEDSPRPWTARAGRWWGAARWGLLALLLVPGPLWAHGDSDEGGESPGTVGDAPNSGGDAEKGDDGARSVRAGVVLTAVGAFFSEAPTPREPSWGPEAGAGHEHLHGGHEPGAEARSGLQLQLQEVEVALRGRPSPGTLLQAYLSATPERVELEEAHATLGDRDAAASLRLGWYYLPLGRFNPQHYLETEPFVDQPLLARRFLGPEQLRGLGAQLLVVLPLPWRATLSAAVASVHDAASFEPTGAASWGLADLVTVARVHQVHPLGARWTLRWGLSGGQGPLGAELRSWLLGVDAEAILDGGEDDGRLIVQAEGVVRHRRGAADGPMEGATYVQVRWRPVRAWELAGRLDVVGRPGALGGDERGGESPFPWQRRWTAAFSLYPSEGLRWRLQYAFDHLEGRAPVHELMVQGQVRLGAHGAHEH